MPNNDVIIPEIDVLVATVFFLKERGVKCYRISVARGRGIDKRASETSAGQLWVTKYLIFIPFHLVVRI